MFRIEGVLYLDGDIFYTHRVYRRRVNHLGAEVAKLHGLDIRQLVDGIGRLDDARVGRHKAIHIGPYLQHFGIQCSCDDSCGIVRTAPSQIRSLHGISVTRNEARNHSHLWYVFESFLDKLVRQLRIQRVLSVLLFRTDEITAVHALAALDEHCYDVRTQAFAIAHDGSLRLLAQVMNQVYTIVDTLQLVEELVYLIE